MMFDREFKELLGGEFLSITGGLAAGIGLAVVSNQIALLPGMFVMLPGFLEMRGNISGSMVGRISTALHMGRIRSYHDRLIFQNILASFFLALTTSLFLGVAGACVTYLLLGIFPMHMIYIALLAGALSNTLEIPFSVFSTVWLFNRGIDPNNVMEAWITSVGDIASVISLFFAVLVIV